MTYVTRREDFDEDRQAWLAAARHALARAFGEEEPEYTLDDIEEGAWKDFPTAEELREDQIDLEILKAWLKKRAAGQAETITLEQLIQELEDEDWHSE